METSSIFIPDSLVVRCMCGCGKPVTVYNGVPRKFVSGHNKARQKPPAYLTCIHCGTQKRVSPYQVNRPFCSTKCRDDFRRARLSEDHPQYKRVEHLCGICGNLFLIAPARVKHNIRYCSRECGNKGRGLKNIKPDSKLHGLNSAQTIVRARDNERCRVCGFDKVVNVHHVVHRKDGGKHTANNLITLCPNHHAMAHRGLLPQDELLALIA